MDRLTKLHRCTNEKTKQMFKHLKKGTEIWQAQINTELKT